MHIINDRLTCILVVDSPSIYLNFPETTMVLRFLVSIWENVRIKYEPQALLPNWVESMSLESFRIHVHLLSSQLSIKLTITIIHFSTTQWPADQKVFLYRQKLRVKCRIVLGIYVVATDRLLQWLTGIGYLLEINLSRKSCLHLTPCVYPPLAAPCT